jgi:glycosyltransferase involved in cell wall biosynthesis
MQSLLPFRKVPCVMIDCLWGKSSNAFYHTLKKVIQKIVSRTVNRFVVWANREIDAFSQTFDIPREKFVFVPYHTTGAEYFKMKPINLGYIFSGGNSDRDYNTLIEAVRGLSVKVVIASTNPKLSLNSSIPENVNIRSYSPEEYLKKMADCSINIVALAPGLLRSAGQQTFLNSMLLGKPTIVTDPEGAADYINNYEDGLFVPPNDVIALREAILLLLNNPEKATAIGEKAKEKAIKYSTEEHFKKIITVVNEVISK